MYKREYLESLVTSAREGSYVFPPEAASEKIRNEIERRTRLKVQILAGAMLKQSNRR
jgi:hypothetical protein